MSEHANEIEQEVNAGLKQPVEHTLYAKLHNMVEAVAATRLGQYFMEKGDSILRTVEHTAKWSLPKEMQNEPRLRPMSWLPFFALIILLRLIRFWLSLAALLIGNKPVTSKDMVHFLQSRRRRLRFVRMCGLKVIREHELAQSKENPCGLMQKLYKVLRIPMCFSKHLCNNETDSNIKMLRKCWAKADAQQSLPRQLSQKRSSSKEAELDMATEEEIDRQLSFNELLAKYAEMSSEEDSNYEPSATEYSSDSSCSESNVETETEIDAETNDKKKDKMAVIDAEIPIHGETNLHMPKPIKMEINSDTESTQNTHLNGNDVVNEHSQKKQLDINLEDERKSTPGHVSAANTKLSQSAVFSNTAAAGSPSEFNTMLQPFNYNCTEDTNTHKEIPDKVQEDIENIEPTNTIIGNPKNTTNEQQIQQQQQQPSQIKPKFQQNHKQSEQKQNHNHHATANHKFRGRYRKKFDA